MGEVLPGDLVDVAFLAKVDSPPQSVPLSSRSHFPASRGRISPMVAPIGVGDVLAGKYRVERVLGRGGMGVVVAARHLRLGERVAIKLPAARMIARGDTVARMVREGRAAMRIRSEHVARVYDAGTLETGEPYLVMEHLDGRALGAILAAEGPLPIEAAVEHVLQACEALAEAHALGIVHRDLKPSNLFLTRRADGSPVIKVIDFGFGVKAIADSNESKRLCPANRCPTDEGVQKNRDARGAAVVSDAAATIGIAAAGAGIYLLLSSRAPRAASRAPGIVPVVGPDVAGLWLRGAW
jgi:serine/threonine protein kinase